MGTHRWYRTHLLDRILERAQCHRLCARFGRNILAAQKVELLELQQAYDQFQQESDLLLTELDHENERLRTERFLHRYLQTVTSLGDLSSRVGSQQ